MKKLVLVVLCCVFSSSSAMAGFGSRLYPQKIQKTSTATSGRINGVQGKTVWSPQGITKQLIAPIWSSNQIIQGTPLRSGCSNGSCNSR